MDTVYDGVLFSEGWPAGCKKLATVAVTLDDKWIGGSQLKNLNDVKAELAKRVKAAGGNALVEFTYGQKSVSFWKCLLSIDDVAWWGKGTAAKCAARE